MNLFILLERAGAIAKVSDWNPLRSENVSEGIYLFDFFSYSF